MISSLIHADSPRNFCAKIATGRGLRAGTSLAPSRCSRALASALLRPVSRLEPSMRSVSATVLAGAIWACNPADSLVRLTVVLTLP